MTFTELWNKIVEVMTYPIPLGGFKLTLVGIIELVFLFVVIVVAEHFVRRHFTLRVLKRTRLDASLQFGIARIMGYIFIGIGFYVALQQTGIDLSSLTVFAGAVGVGLGFGLQNIISNFISGIIILAERPIALGDRVEIDGVADRVSRISLRSTIVTTNDNISIIVPNSDFLTKAVTNWSHGDPKVRFRLPVGVAYGSDIEKFKQVMLQVASAHPAVLQHPEPALFFIAFGESSLDFELGVWTAEMTQNPRRFRSELYFAIENALRQNNISIPFPQRDLHLVSSQVPFQTN